MLINVITQVAKNLVRHHLRPIETHPLRATIVTPHTALGLALPVQEQSRRVVRLVIVLFALPSRTGRPRHRRIPAAVRVEARAHRQIFRFRLLRQRHVQRQRHQGGRGVVLLLHRRLLRHPALVVQQVVPPAELAVAALAGEGLLVRVDEEVGLQLVGVGEHGRAVVAGVGTFARVDLEQKRMMLMGCAL